MEQRGQWPGLKYEEIGRKFIFVDIKNTEFVQKWGNWHFGARSLICSIERANKLLYLRIHHVLGTPGREQNFNDRAQQLQQFSSRAAKTARMVAAGGSSGNKKLAEALLSSASQVCIWVLFPSVYSSLYGTGVLKFPLPRLCSCSRKTYFIYNQMQIE